VRSSFLMSEVVSVSRADIDMLIGSREVRVHDVCGAGGLFPVARVPLGGWIASVVKKD
jgi:hypothetical protein